MRGAERRAPRRSIAFALMAAIGLTTGVACRDDSSKSAPPSTSTASPLTLPSPLGSVVPNPLGAKWDWARVGRYTPFLAELAGGATFYELVWCEVEPDRGRVDWTVVDRIVADSQALGMSPFLKIRVGTCWASGGRGGMERGSRDKTASALPPDLTAYSDFVRAAVTRYAAKSVHVYAIENEVSARNFWEGTAQEYERLADVAAAAIRVADPTAHVLDSGIGSTAYGVGIADRLLKQGKGEEAVAAYQRYYARRFPVRAADFPQIADVGDLEAALGGDTARRNLEFLDAAFRLAHRGVVDAFQLHFYERWDNVAAVLSHLRANLPPGWPVEAWEVGTFKPDGPSDEVTHAAETVKETVALLAGGVSRVIWLPLSHNPEGRHEVEIRYGLVDATGRPRLAGSAYQSHAAAARGEGTKWRAVSNERVTGIAFGRDGESTLVFWSDHEMTLPGPAPGGASARGIEGRPLSWGAGGLTVGPTPVVVTVPMGLDAAVAMVE